MATPFLPPEPTSMPHAAAGPALRRIRRIGVMSMAKMQAVIMGGLGLLIGAFFAIFALTIGSMSGSELGAAETGLIAGMGFAAVLIFPLLYGLLGFLVGAVSALLYNAVAGWLGGIEVEVV